jgi:polysaccharide deacetylase 2 family uncharacterized protein YibQ
MGFFAKLFLPLFAVLAATAIWLLSSYDRGTVFAIEAHLGFDAAAPGTLAPGAGPTSRPRRETADIRARDRYAGAFDRNDPRPRLALIVTGLGLERDATLRAIDRTSPVVTLAFSPYAEDLGPLIERARRRGHEVLIAAPMQPADARHRDAGPAALSVALDRPGLLKRFSWMAGRVPASVGIVGDMGDGFARDGAAMQPLLAVLASRGMVYVDNRVEGPAPAAYGAATVAYGGVATATVRFWLDRTPTTGAIDRALDAAAAAARQHGAAVAIAQPYPLTLERIAAWMKRFDRDHLAAAPISAVARLGS